jgi:thiol-disulfide isomerase/thioredoxin
MGKRSCVLVIATALCLPACAARGPADAGPHRAPARAVPNPPAPAPLLGHVSRADLESYATWKDLRAQDYNPDAAAIKSIAEHRAHVTVLAIVGTWCKDSKRDVPRFFKVADRAHVSLRQVTLVAVDRTKKDTEGLTEKHAITRVPTFVFFRDGKEIGRVTERPVTTLENDIATILNKEQ